MNYNCIPAGSELEVDSDKLDFTSGVVSDACRPASDFDDTLPISNFPGEQLRNRTKNAIPIGDSCRFDILKSALVQSSVDQILQFADCAEYIDLFKCHKVGATQLLAMVEDDFERIGIGKTGDRLRLANFIKQLHRKPWDCPDVLPSDFSSAIEAVRIVSNLHAELTCMESNLVHFRRSFTANSRRLTRNESDPYDQNNMKTLVSEMERCTLAAQNMCHELDRTFHFISDSIAAQPIAQKNGQHLPKSPTVGTVIIFSFSIAVLAVTVLCFKLYKSS